MDKQAYDDQLIIGYLLGSLTEQETESLDELSFSDDEFAGRLQAVENDLVDAYARGELSGQTLERFNAFYMASPLRREKVRLAQVFQATAAPVAVAEPVENHRRVAAEQPGGFWAALRRLFLVPRLAWQGALAVATLLLLAAGGWLALENLRLRSRTQQAQAERDAIERREREAHTQLAEQRSSATEKEKEIASLREQLARLEQQRAPAAARPAAPPSPLPERLNIVPFVLAPQTRGISQPVTLAIPADADYVTLRLELETDEYPAYRAAIKALPGDRVVWRGGNLRARARDDGKALVVSLRPGLLKSRMYILEVSGVSASGPAEIVATYPFRVTKQ